MTIKKTIEDKCIWNESLEGNQRAEGRMQSCKKCDGYNTNCEYYLTKRDLKKYGN